ncbi:MAG: DUF120 domain-containing protein [Candidatus Micrarchaeota archaeon]
MEKGKMGLLLNLAKMGALQNKVRVSAAGLAIGLGVSQQTANRWLLEMQAEGLLIRSFAEIVLTQKAAGELEGLQKELEEIFRSRGKKIKIYGRVVGGMHEGRYYLSIPEYKRQLQKALKFEIYPGTLNIKLEGEGSVEGKQKLMANSGIGISGFRKNGRVLGGAKVFPAKIFSKKMQRAAAAIIPFKSHYGSEVLELISSEFLRKSMHLKNGQELEVIVDL